MIPGIVAGAPVAGGIPPATFDPYVAATHPTGRTGTNVYAAVPSGAETGDALVMVVRVRGDRSITVAPSGFTTTIDQTFGTSTSNNTQRVYVFTKAYAGETTISCTQGSSSAHGVSLYVVRGSVVNSTADRVLSNTDVVTITKIGTNNGLLALGLVIAGSGFTTANPTQTDWTQRGTDYFSTNDYFGVGYSRAHSGSTASAHIGAGVTLGGIGAPNAVVILEVAAP